MTVPSESDCRCNREMVCPYCGEEQSDSWEHSGDDGEAWCGSCSRPFRYARYVDVTYNTSPIMGPHQLSEFARQQELEDSDG